MFIHANIGFVEHGALIVPVHDLVVYGDNFELLNNVQWVDDKKLMYGAIDLEASRLQGDIVVRDVRVQRLKINLHAKCIFIQHRSDGHGKETQS